MTVRMLHQYTKENCPLRRFAAPQQVGSPLTGKRTTHRRSADYQCLPDHWRLAGHWPEIVAAVRGAQKTNKTFVQLIAEA